MTQPLKDRINRILSPDENDNKCCPFCGSIQVDPEGVASIKQDTVEFWKDAAPEHIEHSQACDVCSATADEWNNRYYESIIRELLAVIEKQREALEQCAPTKEIGKQEGFFTRWNKNPKRTIWDEALALSEQLVGIVKP